MALTFDYKACNDDLLTDAHYEATVEKIVFNTMFVGMPHIREDNFVLFALRIGILDAAMGYETISLGRMVEKVYPWVGLRTNASSMTNAEFMKKVQGIVNDKSQQQIWVNEDTGKLI